MPPSRSRGERVNSTNNTSLVHVVVVGSGFAAIGAVVAARSEGARVTLISGGTGASGLYSGAVDQEPWDHLALASRMMGFEQPIAGALDASLAALCEELGLWTLPDSGPMPLLATIAGVVRPARGHDHAQLDLRRVAGHTVLLPRADRMAWDADSLARCLTEACPASLDIRFQAVPAPVLRYDEERNVVDVDLAARHDDADRLAWLAAQLRQSAKQVAVRDASPVAFLLGPWLGAAASRAAELEAQIAAPVGELLSASSGTAGFRFEAARDALLKRAGVKLVSGLVRSVTTTKKGVKIQLLNETMDASAVVLAVGGLLGGGVVYEPSEHEASAEGPSKARTACRLSFTVPDSVRVTDGVDRGGFGSSAFGPALDQRAWPSGLQPGFIERAGILVSDGCVASQGIFAAGDCAFGGRRTVLAALGSGLLAGARATADALRILEVSP